MKTKNLYVKGISLGLAIFSFWGMSVLLGSGSTSSANSEGLSVSGVQNVTQYLTSLVLQSPSGKSIIFSYDTELGGVRINGKVNVNDIIIGGTNEASQNAVVLGGENNKAKGEVVAVAGGKFNEISNNSAKVIIAGGEKNKIMNGRSAVILASKSGSIE